MGAGERAQEKVRVRRKRRRGANWGDVMEYTRVGSPGHGGEARPGSCPLRAEDVAEREPRGRIAPFGHCSAE